MGLRSRVFGSARGRNFRQGLLFVRVEARPSSEELGGGARWRTARGVGGLAELFCSEGIRVCRMSRKGVDVKRLGSLVVVSSVVAVCVVGLAGVTGASAASTLPTLNLALTGKTGIKVSGSTVSGAVNVTSTFSGKGQGGFGLVRLNPGVQFQQAFQSVQNHHGDINALTPFGSLIVDAGAPGTIQTVLTPGSYVALNVTGNGQPGFEQFTVTPSSSPASLPAAKATETSIEFGFKGPKVLHDGTMVRLENDGFLVHMDVLIGARNKAGANKIIALLKAGKDHKAQKLATSGATLMGPASPGAMQQEILNAKAGYYVQACFMDTQDGREHTQLGMERLVRIAK
jgi:hypothetical protein